VAQLKVRLLGLQCSRVAGRQLQVVSGGGEAVRNGKADIGACT
jgi:hypothetical protein